MRPLLTIAACIPFVVTTTTFSATAQPIAQLTCDYTGLPSTCSDEDGVLNAHLLHIQGCIGNHVSQRDWPSALALAKQWYTGIESLYPHSMFAFGHASHIAPLVAICEIQELHRGAPSLDHKWYIDRLRQALTTTKVPYWTFHTADCYERLRQLRSAPSADSTADAFDVLVASRHFPTSVALPSELVLHARFATAAAIAATNKSDYRRAAECHLHALELTGRAINAPPGRSLHGLPTATILDVLDRAVVHPVSHEANAQILAKVRSTCHLLLSNQRHTDQIYLKTAELLYAVADGYARKPDRHLAIEVLHECNAICHNMPPFSANAIHMKLSVVETLALLQMETGALSESDSLHRSVDSLVETLRPLMDYEMYLEHRARICNNHGALCHKLANLTKAKHFLRSAVNARRSLANAKRTTESRRALAYSLANYSAVCRGEGDYDVAMDAVNEAIQLAKEVFPASEYRSGHPMLLVLYMALSECLQMRGQLTEAESYSQQAVEMVARLENASSSFVFEPLMAAAAYGQLSDVMIAQRRNGHARQHAIKALHALDERAERTIRPQEFEQRCVCVARLAKLFSLDREYEAALGLTSPIVEDIVSGRIDKRLTAGRSVHSLYFQRAFALFAMGDAQEAAGIVEKVLTDRYRVTREQFLGLTDFETLVRAREHLSFPGLFVNVWENSKEDAEWIYLHVWRQRALVLRYLVDRNRALAANQSWELVGLLDARRRAAQSLRALSQMDRNDPGHEASLATMLVDLDDVSRRIAEELPSVSMDLDSVPRNLAERLGQNTCYLHFWEFRRLVESDNFEPSSHYGVFLVQRGRPVGFVELGPKDEIDAAVLAFRQKVVAGEACEAEGRAVRQRVWEPVERLFPAGVTTIYLTTDGHLHQLPWPCLPGKTPQSVLLEDYALATVPSGHFLCEWLDERPATTGIGRVLAVGDVDYDGRDSTDATKLAELVEVIRPAARSGVGRFVPLAGTRRELENLTQRVDPEQLVTLRGRQATLTRVLEELPRARYAHFATHGFFADPKFRSLLSPGDVSVIPGQSRGSGSLERHPMLLSGLVLAGANVTPSLEAAGTGAELEPRPFDDDGILTADTISFLRLSGLEVAVLSACETGLGKVAGGEGVLGLQRAFHMAGARNVIASSWKIDDAATAVLMDLFHEEWLVRGASPLEALRRAQLTLRRQPDLVRNAQNARGRIDFSKTVKTVPVDKLAEKGAGAPTLHPVYWAAFQLSGSGR